MSSHGTLGVDAERLGDALEHLLQPAERELAVGQQGALVDADGAVRHHQVRVDLLREPRPWQAGQAPCGVLKQKMRGSISGSEMPQWTQANFSLKVSVRASSPASSTSTRPSARAAAVSTESVSRRLQPLLHDEPVDDDGDVVLELLVEVDVLLELAHLAVDLDAREAVGAQLLEELAVLALAPAHDRGDDAEARARLELADVVDDLLHALPRDGPAALRAVRVADAGEEQAQVVVDLGDRAHGGPRVAGVVFWSMEMAGERPSMLSTSGLSIWPRNWRA